MVLSPSYTNDDDDDDEDFVIGVFYQMPEKL